MKKDGARSEVCRRLSSQTSSVTAPSRVHPRCSGGPKLRAGRSLSVDVATYLAQPACEETAKKSCRARKLEADH